jgi:hypothetical protein
MNEPTLTRVGLGGNSAAAWRKLLLRRREQLLQRSELFEQLWHEAFPVHCILTLRYEPPSSRAETCWLCPSWKRAARAYHAERRGHTLVAEIEPKKIKLLRRLLHPSVSLEQAWNELNEPRNRPTPQVVVEAIWHAVRERGLGALEEPGTKARLSTCDIAARTELQRRIARHFGGGNEKL